MPKIISVFLLDQKEIDSYQIKSIGSKRNRFLLDQKEINSYWIKRNRFLFDQKEIVFQKNMYEV